MRRLSPKKSVFFIGIGGIGISALARWYKAQKWAVFGSDLVSGEIIRELQKEGCSVKIGHKKGNLSPKIGLVIYNQAIPRDNPELVRARELGIKTLSYPKALGELTQRYKTIAVAGAHGKSTTTALVSLILIKAGLDPTVIIGTKLEEFKNKNFRMGGSIPSKSNPERIDTERRLAPANVLPYLIIEADEWRASFHHYSPTLAIITNIDREHLDFYKNLTNIKKSFLKFIGNIQRNGTLVVNAENPVLWSMRKQIEKICARNGIRVMWYGIQKPEKTNVLLSHDRKIKVNYEVVARKIKKVLKIPGEHNVSNALAAYTLGRALNIPEKKILSALSAYRGSWRRMEFRGQLKTKNYKLKTLVYDDYAHHPTEIKATLAAFREKYPNHKLICVFQPHQAKRLQALFKEFQTAFYDADALVLLPIYKVPGRDNPRTRYNSELLAKTIKLKGYLKEVHYSPLYGEPAESTRRLKSTLQSLVVSSNHQPLTTKNSIVIMMGAGDIVEYSKHLVK